MTEKEILDKIRQSAELEKIPENLKPEQMIEQLHEKKQRKKFQWQAKHLVAAALLLVVMLAATPLILIESEYSKKEKDENITENITIGMGEIAETEKEEVLMIKKQDAGELYTVAKSEQEVLTFLKETADTQTAYVENLEEAEMESAVSDSVSNAVSESMQIKYSETNVQMAGVDESDIVKTNGSHIFVVKDGAVQIVKIENGTLESIGTVTPQFNSFSDRILEMYVENEKLILIVQCVKDSLTDANIVPQTENTIEVCYEDIAYCWNVDYSTILYTYDISNATNPKLIGTIEQDGIYQTSRKIGDMLYLFTQKQVVSKSKMLETENRVLLESLPKVNGETISYESIYLPKQGGHGLVVSSVSLDNPNQIVDKTLIFHNSVEIYVSSNAMYLYQYSYETDGTNTQIAKFRLEDGKINAVGAAVVPGTIQDTFAINEYENNLRILTTKWNNTLQEYTNQLYLLDETMNATGKIEHIAEGETIYAARYFGDIAYFVTYKNIDPLFVADLSDKNHPKLLGQLKISGYSEYLHLWDDEKLFGIGYETDERDGTRKGLKLVMFDISNSEELSVVDSVVLKEVNSSPALYDYKTVLVDADKNVIGFITTNYQQNKLAYQVYSFIDGQFQKELFIEKDDISNEKYYRGLWVDDYFYLVSPKGVQSFDIVNGYQAVEEIAFP